MVVVVVVRAAATAQYRDRTATATATAGPRNGPKRRAPRFWGLALVFRRRSPQPDVDQMHQDKYTGAHVYQMDDPAEDVPGGVRWLLSFGADRSMLYSRMEGGVLVPMQLPDVCATAQVIGQSARAAGAPRYEEQHTPQQRTSPVLTNLRSRTAPALRAPTLRQLPPAPRSEGGERGNLWHGRINSAAAGLEVTVRLDMRLPSLSTSQLPVPALGQTFAYGLFHCSTSYQGVGRGKRMTAPPISMEERFVKRHCGRCMQPLSQSDRKAANEGGWYWVCSVACKGMDSSEPWKCPTAAEGGNDECKCCCSPKQAAVSYKRKGKAKLFSSSKQLKHQAARRAAG
jgi:hypothetical protein